MEIFSTGAPSGFKMLNCKWKRVTPIRENNVLYHSECNDYKVKYIYPCWYITSKDDCDIYVYAKSVGRNPLSVYETEWIFPDLYTYNFKFKLDKSFSKIYSMEELGYDYFVRATPASRPIMFIDPRTGSVEHSAAKPVSNKQGKRYCPYCNQSYSANNFCHQHLKVHGILKRKHGMKYCASEKKCPINLHNESEHDGLQFWQQKFYNDNIDDNLLQQVDDVLKDDNYHGLQEKADETQADETQDKPQETQDKTQDKTQDEQDENSDIFWKFLGLNQDDFLQLI